MSRSRSLSPAARLVLAALAEAGTGGSYGYDLSRRAGVKSGTLYPLLIRLESQGYLEAEWLVPEPGRPPRHLYRLTAAGRALALQHAPTAATGQAVLGRPA